MARDSPERRSVDRRDRTPRGHADLERSRVPVRTRAFVAVALFVFVAEVVCALVPAPGKYPYGVPVVVALTAIFSAVRLRGGDDASAYLAIAASVAALSAWTLGDRMSLGIEVAFGVFALLLALPAAVVVLALVRSGSADHPDMGD